MSLSIYDRLRKVEQFTQLSAQYPDQLQPVIDELDKIKQDLAKNQDDLDNLTRQYHICCQQMKDAVAHKADTTQIRRQIHNLTRRIVRQSIREFEQSLPNSETINDVPKPVTKTDYGHLTPKMVLPTNFRRKGPVVEPYEPEYIEPEPTEVDPVIPDPDPPGPDPDPDPDPPSGQKDEPDPSDIPDYEPDFEDAYVETYTIRYTMRYTRDAGARLITATDGEFSTVIDTAVLGLNVVQDAYIETEHTVCTPTYTDYLWYTTIYYARISILVVDGHKYVYNHQVRMQSKSNRIKELSGHSLHTYQIIPEGTVVSYSPYPSWWGYYMHSSKFSGIKHHTISGSEEFKGKGTQSIHKPLLIRFADAIFEAASHIGVSVSGSKPSYSLAEQIRPEPIVPQFNIDLDIDDFDLMLKYLIEVEKSVLYQSFFSPVHLPLLKSVLMTGDWITEEPGYVVANSYVRKYHLVPIYEDDSVDSVTSEGSTEAAAGAGDAIITSYDAGGGSIMGDGNDSENDETRRVVPLEGVKYVYVVLRNGSVYFRSTDLSQANQAVEQFKSVDEENNVNNVSYEIRKQILPQ